MTVNPTELMDELHIDQSPTELTTVTNLINEATEIVNHSVNSSSKTHYQTSPIYDLAIKTLTTQLYYDRELSKGMSVGLLMMLDQLQGMISGSDPDGT
ncbi:head-tail connector protein [Lentilactobacillus buchneri]|uniref:head-tail connector protein n=1 Tax=Lentilactobacillus buchneri TaxID=1581 RepID=UPI00201C08ED